MNTGKQRGGPWAHGPTIGGPPGTPVQKNDQRVSDPRTGVAHPIFFPAGRRGWAPWWGPWDRAHGPPVRDTSKTGGFSREGAHRLGPHGPCGPSNPRLMGPGPWARPMGPRRPNAGALFQLPNMLSNPCNMLHSALQRPLKCTSSAPRCTERSLRRLARETTRRRQITSHESRRNRTQAPAPKTSAAKARATGHRSRSRRRHRCGADLTSPNSAPRSPPRSRGSRSGSSARRPPPQASGRPSRSPSFGHPAPMFGHPATPRDKRHGRYRQRPVARLAARRRRHGTPPRRRQHKRQDPPHLPRGTRLP